MPAGFGGDTPPKNPLTFPDRDSVPVHADPDFAGEAGFKKKACHAALF